MSLPSSFALFLPLTESFFKKVAVRYSRFTLALSSIALNSSTRPFRTCNTAIAATQEGGKNYVSKQVCFHYSLCLCSSVRAARRWVVPIISVMVGVKPGDGRCHGHVKAIMKVGESVRDGDALGRARPHAFTACLSYDVPCPPPLVVLSSFPVLVVNPDLWDF